MFDSHRLHVNAGVSVFADSPAFSLFMRLCGLFALPVIPANMHRFSAKNTGSEGQGMT
jgi:hypothetical protein